MRLAFLPGCLPTGRHRHVHRQSRMQPRTDGSNGWMDGRLVDETHTWSHLWRCVVCSGDVMVAGDVVTVKQLQREFFQRTQQHLSLESKGSIADLTVRRTHHPLPTHTPRPTHTPLCLLQSRPTSTVALAPPPAVLLPLPVVVVGPLPASLCVTRSSPRPRRSSRAASSPCSSPRTCSTVGASCGPTWRRSRMCGP